MKNCEQFAHRIDICDSNMGMSLNIWPISTITCLRLALIVPRQRWPDAYIELWQGKRIIWHTRHNQLL